MITSVPGCAVCHAPGTSASARDQIMVTFVCRGAGARESSSISLLPSTSSLVG
jgi:hypothetical protein